MKFTEEKLEIAFIELFGNEKRISPLKHQHCPGSHEVLIEADSKLSITPVKFII